MSGEFDPLDYANLTRHVVEELMRQPLLPLDTITPFNGAGVYALFYQGPLPFYAPLVSKAPRKPIYVGKATPPGGRKGLSTSLDHTALYKRLKDHQKSIEAASNLSPGDFLCRYLVVKPLWIVMAERFLLTHYQPAWNSCVDGFGNHDPGSRREGRRSRWDTLHPGRVDTWSAKVVDVYSRGDVLAQLAASLA